MKQLLFSILIFLILLAGCSTNSEPTTDIEQSELNMSVLKIGKADAIIIQIGEKSVLIDAGEEDDGKEILDFLAQQNITTLDVMIVTHFDKDHVGGADQILKQLTVKELLLPDYEGTHKEYDEFIAALENTDISEKKLDSTYTFKLENVAFTVYPPKNTMYDGDNDHSLVTAIELDQVRMLLAGDAEAIRLQELIDDGLGSFDVLKVPHHGRYNENSQAFIDMTSPTYAIITSSDKNPEEDELIAELKQIGADIFVTRQGDIQLTTDGQSITIKQQ